MSVAKKTATEIQIEKLFNPAAFVETTKDEFMKTYKGKVPVDVVQAWNWIVKNRPKKEK